MRKLSWALLLPFFLLFAQQGELRHEYSHYHQTPAGSQKRWPADSGHCPLCLAYAHLAGAATTDIAPPTLLSNLRFQLAPALDVASHTGKAATPRSRGPPLSP
jgi:hypothetical protein